MADLMTFSKCGQTLALAAEGTVQVLKFDCDSVIVIHVSLESKGIKISRDMF